MLTYLVVNFSYLVYQAFRIAFPLFLLRAVLNILVVCTKMSLDLDTQFNIVVYNLLSFLCASKIACCKTVTTEEVAVCKPVKKDKLTSFMETLTPVEVTSLQQAILEAHKNDKRLYTTMLNWISKSTCEFTQTTNMFRTALNRKRGKAILNAWYTKYEKYTSK